MLKEAAHFENYVQGSIQDWKRKGTGKIANGEVIF